MYIYIYIHIYTYMCNVLIILRTMCKCMCTLFASLDSSEVYQIKTSCTTSCAGGMCSSVVRYGTTVPKVCAQMPDLTSSA